MDGNRLESQRTTAATSLLAATAELDVIKATLRHALHVQLVGRLPLDVTDVLLVAWRHVEAVGGALLGSQGDA